MGRWAQQRRRGGSPGATPAPPPAIPQIIAVLVEVSLTGIRIAFDLPVTLNASPTDGSFTVEGNEPTALSQVGPTEIDASIAPLSSDSVPWDLTAQPPWLDEVVQTPASGTTAPA